MSKKQQIDQLATILIIFLFFSGCSIKPPVVSDPTQPVTLTVLAAASLTEVFDELGQQFENLHPGTRVEYNFAGSQQLAQQIGNGAPADVFASADLRQMDTAIAAKRVNNAAVRTFAHNRLVIIYSKEGKPNVRSLMDLSKPGLKIVLASEEVPIGKYSVDFLASASKDPSFGASFQSRVLGNVVSYEGTVKAVLTKVLLGEADAGIVYTSDTFGTSEEKIGKVTIPDSLNVVAQYPIAPLVDSHQPALSQEFITFVLSPVGQQTLARYGFTPIEK